MQIGVFFLNILTFILSAESVSLNSLEFQSVSDGFDIAIIPSERENRIHGYMRLQPSAIKEAATVEHDTVNIIQDNFFCVPNRI